MPKPHIVIIEDDSDISELLKLHLENNGYRVTTFSNGQDGLDFLLTEGADALVLDLNLNGLSGIDVCRELRNEGSNTPILMLTARSEEGDKVTGLETGADDYMTKPFSVREFVARMKAMLRRSNLQIDVKEAQQPIRIKDLEINPLIRKVTLKSERLELTPKEFELLFLLASNPGVTFDRAKLLNKVWGYNFEGYEHTVNSHINRLRSKLEEDPANPHYVLTTWGVGYRFTDA